MNEPGRMRGQRSLILIGLLCLLAACTSTAAPLVNGNSAGKPVDDLLNAASATLSLDSFHADVTVTVPSSSPPTGTGTVDYKAPDMEVEHLGSGITDETISIGDTVYAEVRGRPGYFWTAKHPGRAGVGDTLGPIEWVKKAENVQFDGRTYTFELPPGDLGSVAAATGEATVSEGFLATLTLRYPVTKGDADVSMTFVYSAFNEPVSVEAPPSDHILESPLETCPSPSSSPNGIFVPVCSTP